MCYCNTLVIPVVIFGLTKKQNSVVLTESSVLVYKFSLYYYC